MLKHIYLRIINVEKSLKKININNKLDSNLKHSKSKDNLYEQIYKEKKNNFIERNINNYYHIENEDAVLEKCSETCGNSNLHTSVNISNNRNNQIENILNMENVKSIVIRARQLTRSRLLRL